MMSRFKVVEIVILLLLVSCNGQSGRTDSIPTLVPNAAQTQSALETAEILAATNELPPTFTPGAPSVSSTTISAEDNQQFVDSSTSVPQNTPMSTATLLLIPTNAPESENLMVSPVGTVRFDHWLFEVTEAHSDPGSTPGRHTVVLIGILTNEGTQTDTVTLLSYDLKMRDGQGRVYDPDQVATFAAEDRYNTESSVSISPGASRRIAVAFDVVGDAISFTLLPGDLVASWSGDASFTFTETAVSDGELSEPSIGTVGTVRFDHWVFAVTQVHADPGMGSGRRAVVLLGYLTNEGNQTDTVVFTGYYIKLRDSQGRVYDPDLTATFAAEDKYGTESTASINPGASRYIAVAFDTPADASTFTLIPGDLTSSWGGDVTFTLP